MQVTRTGSGLLVAEQAADFQSVQRSLREHDRDLRLVPQPLPDGRPCYRVYKWRGDDRPAVCVLSWMDDRLENPLPLSHRIVEQVKMLDRSTRGGQTDEDEHNNALRARVEKELEDRMAETADELARRSRRSPSLHRGQHLRRSRHKPGGRWTQ